MSDIINDGGVVGFTRRVTLSTSGVVILDDFKYDVGNNATFKRTNEKSKTTGQVWAKGERTGSATAQLADSTVNPSLYWGQTFSTTEGVEVVNWVITGTGRAETKSGETKAPIAFCETVGAVVVS